MISAAVVGLLVFITVDIMLILRFRNIKHKNSLLELQNRFSMEMNEARVEAASQVMKDIAAELHDNVGQHLSISLMQLQLAKSKDPELAGKLDTVLDLLKETTADIRQLSHLLSGDLEEKLELEGGIMRIKNTLEKGGIMQTDFEVCEIPFYFSPSRELLLLRVVQELVNNSLKHARATVLTLRLTIEGENLQFLYQDNGIGFNVNEAPSEGLGMKSIGRRLQLLQAEWKIFAEEKKGFLLEAITPLKEK